MTYDREPFNAARHADLLKQESRRLAHSLAARIRASQYTHGDGDLTVHAADVELLAAEILNLGDITDETGAKAMTALDQLAAYLDASARRRAEAVDRLASRFTPRELRLIREAAVMGYVQGVMNGPHRDAIPPDEQIAREVMDACLSHPDLYPTITDTPRSDS